MNTKPTVCISCIGTGHNASEDALVLVKLWKSCLLADLGIEGNHTADGLVGSAAHNVAAHLPGLKRLVDAEPKRIKIDPKRLPVYGGWKWINEGQNSHGGGLHRQLLANVALIRALNPLPQRIVLIGHSRGAVLCVGIAAELERQMSRESQSVPECHLFLYDPVKWLARTSEGGIDFHELPQCVTRTRIIAMEDEDSLLGFKFPLLQTGAKADDYLRLPGTHGTATQVTGHAIGQLGYMLALEWLAEIAVPMRGGVSLRDEDFCYEYDRVMQRHPVRNGQRKVNDAGKLVTVSAAVDMKRHGVGARNSVLDPITGPNRWQGSLSFVNEDHFRRFQRRRNVNKPAGSRH